MKERPILFNGQMVRAILNGTKTQTRRVVKPEGADHLFQFLGREGDATPTGEWAWCSSSHVVSKHIRCPYGQPGDRLWVREAWARDDEDGTLLFRADDNEATRNWEHERVVSGLQSPRWRPSIHMPRWASRITLEIVSVRVERLQDISEADATAEGTPHSMNLPAGRLASENYAHLWECINGDGSWAANPWVWVVEFRRIEA